MEEQFQPHLEKIIFYESPELNLAEDPWAHTKNFPQIWIIWKTVGEGS